MPISGILLTCSKENVAKVAREVSDLDWAETHYEEPDGRIVLTVEAETTEIGMSRLLQIQTLPLVTSAEMFEHFMGDEPVPTDDRATHAVAMERLNRPREEPLNRSKK